MNRDLSLLIGILVAIVGLLLLWIFYSTLAMELAPRLGAPAIKHLPESGVSNPVTAVLLNYRAYDTLLELGVLLTALLGIWSLGPPRPGFQGAGPALSAMVSIVVPLAILTGGYLLWVGGHAPGGAFQAGALLGAAGVVMRLAGNASAGLPSEAWQRWLVVLGAGVFSLVGLVLAIAGYGFLTYPPGQAKWLILLIEAAATIAIGATLAAAYVGGRPAPWQRTEAPRRSSAAELLQ